MNDLYKNCTIDCERRVNCVICNQTKGPRGRSIAPEMANSYCGWDCPGYTQEPSPGHLWPGELAQIRENESCEENI